jgi:hypothetical protein
VGETNIHQCSDGDIVLVDNRVCEHRVPPAAYAHEIRTRRAFARVHIGYQGGW